MNKLSKMRLFPLSLFYQLCVDISFQSVFFKDCASFGLHFLILILRTLLEALDSHGAAMRLSVAVRIPPSCSQGSNQLELSLDISPSDKHFFFSAARSQAFPVPTFSLFFPNLYFFIAKPSWQLKMMRS